MKRAILSLFILFMVCNHVSEGENVPDELIDVFMVGQYVVYKHEIKGYSVLKDNTRSEYYITLTRAINSINERSIR